MNTFQKLSPVFWPVLGTVILLTLMVVATKLAWRDDQTALKEVESQNDFVALPVENAAEEVASNEVKLPPAENDLDVSSETSFSTPATTGIPTTATKATKSVQAAEVSSSAVAPPLEPAPKAAVQQQPRELKHNAAIRRFPVGLEGYCPVTLLLEQKWRKGDGQWMANHQGRTYLFVSAQQQQQFIADPDHYGPAAAGHDVVLFEQSGRLVPGQSRFGAVYEDHIYLFANEQTVQAFLDDPQRFGHQFEVQPYQEKFVANAVADSPQDAVEPKIDEEYYDSPCSPLNSWGD